MIQKVASILGRQVGDTGRQVSPIQSKLLRMHLKVSYRLNVGLGEWRRSKHAAVVQRRSLRVGRVRVRQTSAARRHIRHLQRRRRLQRAASRVRMIRRRNCVGGDVIDRPEVDVVGVCTSDRKCIGGDVIE